MSAAKPPAPPSSISRAGAASLAPARFRWRSRHLRSGGSSAIPDCTSVWLGKRAGGQGIGSRQLRLQLEPQMCTSTFLHRVRGPPLDKGEPTVVQAVALLLFSRLLQRPVICLGLSFLFWFISQIM